MHSVRRAAHRAASQATAGSTNYNPFARTRSREAQMDTENLPHQTKSETELSPAIEEERRAESRQAEKDFPAPPHAGTEPVSPTSAERAATSTAGNDLTHNKESANLSGVTAAEGVTKRAKFKNIFRKSSDSDDDIARVESEGLEREEKIKRAHKRKIPVGHQIKAVLFDSWINVLLVFVPVGFAVYYAHIDNAIAIFIINFIAIIPLAAMLSYATEELALRVGETFGGLLNATFGNAVELIVSIQALIKDEITIVKTSLIGSMLSNLLLVLGMSFFLGGVNRVEQHFNVTVAQTAASLLALCIGSLIIPTVFHQMLVDDQENTAGDDRKRIDELSRGTAIILLFVYACYLIFQLKSHVSMYNAPSQKTPKRKSSKVEEGATSRGIAAIGAGTAAASGGTVNASKLVNKSNEEEEDEDDIELPQLTVIGALVTLGISTALVAFCSEFMVESIHGLTDGGRVSTVFVGLILLPIVGNAAEHATAVTVAMKDKMDLSIGVAVGSSMQIALLVLPLAVILGWILNKCGMDLYFDIFQIAVLFVAVLLVNYLIQDGKSHWLEGVLLMSSYIIIAVAAWFYPEIKETTCQVV
ncbi:vacuolar calcium ion transporter-like protein /H(+) exchanger [Polyplosphaeria fusca]|uniref:Vacuolar calcium ion transporter-like protein /H(+) exchanger n=1 Tax=Polyplosphaeria fusca TaxID=682080 RepID=A0A9P4V702_9PLEO|nr:vacuolar calcium ion transporter-like protein /H(+) exchanger [Polyplosphaeria fusca]